MKSGAGGRFSPLPAQGLMGVNEFAAACKLAGSTPSIVSYFCKSPATVQAQEGFWGAQREGGAPMGSW